MAKYIYTLESQPGLLYALDKLYQGCSISHNDLNELINYLKIGKAGDFYFKTLDDMTNGVKQAESVYALLREKAENSISLNPANPGGVTNIKVPGANGELIIGSISEKVVGFLSDASKFDYKIIIVISLALFVVMMMKK